MSTPIPPNSKLEGLELYAPRWPRTHQGSASGDPASHSEPYAAPDDRPQANDDEPFLAAAESAEATHARLDEAIRLAIDVGRSSDDREPARSAASLPPAANLRLPQANRQPSAGEPSPHDRHFTPSGRRRALGLDPEILPEPPIDTQRHVVASLLVRVASIGGFAAVAAYGLTMISTSQPEAGRVSRASDKVAAVAPVPPPDTVKPKSQARLVVENRQAFANEPVSLGVSIDRATGNELLLLAGLTAGTRLSAGAPINDSSWQLPSRELHNVYMYAPKDFVGVMNTAVNLLASNDKLVDARAVQFAWVAKKLSPPPRAADRTDNEFPSMRVRPIDREQDALLMKRGEELLNAGDIAGARRAFQHLADAGNADAAVALGATYDPAYLVDHNVIGVVGDAAKARGWYQRAVELGSLAAKNILERMAEK